MIQTSTIDGEVSIFMPLKLKKRGERKMILAPQGVQYQRTLALISRC
jgi:hypothetical protein